MMNISSKPTSATLKGWREYWLVTKLRTYIRFYFYDGDMIVCHDYSNPMGKDVYQYNGNCPPEGWQLVDGRGDMPEGWDTPTPPASDRGA